VVVVVVSSEVGLVRGRCESEETSVTLTRSPAIPWSGLGTPRARPPRLRSMKRRWRSFMSIDMTGCFLSLPCSTAYRYGAEGIENQVERGGVWQQEIGFSLRVIVFAAIWGFVGVECECYLTQ
jgi:hypothetical protein